MSAKSRQRRGLINRTTEKLMVAFLDGVPFDDPDFQDAIDKDLKRMERGEAEAHKWRSVEARKVRHIMSAQEEDAVIEAVARDCWRDALEFSDRTSPEEYPDMILINFAEVKDFLARAILTYQKATAGQADLGALLHNIMPERAANILSVADFEAIAKTISAYKATSGARDADMPDSIKEDGKSGKWWLKQVNRRAGQDSPQGVGNAAALQRYIDYLERAAGARDEWRTIEVIQLQPDEETPGLWIGFQTSADRDKIMALLKEKDANAE